MRPSTICKHIVDYWGGINEDLVVNKTLSLRN